MSKESRMSDKYYLPQQIEHYLRGLALQYETLEDKLLRKIIVNAKYKIEEGIGYDNWNGGCYGHDVMLIIPDSLYCEVLKRKKDIESKIHNDLRELATCENEYWQSVYIDVESNDDNWRSRHEDALLRKIKNVSSSAVSHIWGNLGVRLFLSHKIEYKKETEKLKEELKVYGISSFVAHTSIQPTREWLKEIENALLSMDAFVALLCDKFRESQWTDQEVGYAFCRGVPIISISLTEQDPHGFMSKDQKMLGSWDDIPKMAADIFSVLAEKPGFAEKLKDAAVEAFVNAPSFFESMHFVQKILPCIKFLTEGQIEKIKIGFANNNQLHGCYVVTKELDVRLYEITGKKFRIENRQLIEVSKV